MPRYARRHRLTSWIAIFAVLLTVLAPGVSYALAQEGSAWVELCTAEGMVRVPAGDEPADAPAGLGAGGGCPYCAAHAFGFALPPQPAPWPAVADRAVQARLPAGMPVTGRADWSSSRPRAPPAA